MSAADCASAAVCGRACDAVQGVERVLLCALFCSPTLDNIVIDVRCALRDVRCHAERAAGAQRWEMESTRTCLRRTGMPRYAFTLTLRNQRLEIKICMQFVPEMRFLVCDFGVSAMSDTEMSQAARFCPVLTYASLLCDVQYWTAIRGTADLRSAMRCPGAMVLA